MLATARAVFPYAYRYANFVYASAQPLVPDANRLREVRRPDGSFFTFEGAPAGSVAALLAQAHLDPVEGVLAHQKAKAGVITDDNLLSEYAHGQRFGPDLLRALTPPQAPLFQ